jgi:hypothetical protein
MVHYRNIMSTGSAPAIARAYSVEYPRRLVAGEEGQFRVSLDVTSTCVEVLMEFDSKSIWVSGEGRIPGSPLFRLTTGTGGVHSFAFGSVGENSANVMVSLFFRDGSGAVLASQDCVIQFEKAAVPPGHLGEVLETLKWIHQRLNVAMYLLFIGAAIVGALWLYLKFGEMTPEKLDATLIRMHMASPRYKGEWKETVPIDQGDRKSWLNHDDWNRAAQQWPVIPPSAAGPTNGYLRVNTTAWGMPRPEVFDNEELYDFTFGLTASLPPTFRCSWALRAQQGASRGYIFTVFRFNNFIHISGIAQRRFGSVRLIPVHGFEIGVDCCRKGDFFTIQMQVSKYDFRVTEFSLRNLTDFNNRNLLNAEIIKEAKKSPYMFHDGYESFRYGGLALFTDDPSNAPEVGPVDVSDAK